MIFFAGCKINIGLDVLRRREDAYHDIETVMFPVENFCDALEIVPSKIDEFTWSGIEIDCAPEKNLCIKALRLMQKNYGVPAVRMHLHKAVPFGAGLGGGSSDAAFTIKGLNSLFELGLPIAQMEALAAQLGSDTTFFIRNTPVLASGRGEVLTQCNISLKNKYLVILKPAVSISTAEAYSSVAPHIPTVPLTDRIARGIYQWKYTVTNDFEKSIFAIHPRLEVIKDSLYSSGATYAAMTGSGSALFGIFDQKPPTLNDIHDIVVYQGYIV